MGGGVGAGAAEALTDAGAAVGEDSAAEGAAVGGGGTGAGVDGEHASGSAKAARNHEWRMRE
jgi:hypothetical protein